MVDQTKIPYAFEKVEIKTLDSMFDAIKTNDSKGGAPAIGIAGAHGCALLRWSCSQNSADRGFMARYNSTKY